MRSVGLWAPMCGAVVFLMAGAGCAGLRYPGGMAFYVAPDGADENPGTKARPFASLEAARDAIREVKGKEGLPPGGVKVYLREGAYYLDSTFALGKGDSGDARSPIVYRAYGREEVRLVGGRAVSGFEPVVDPAVLARIPEAAHGQVVQTDLRAQGIEDFGEMKPRGMGRPGYPAGLELFLDGRPMQIARWPNEDWCIIAEAQEPAEDRFGFEGDRPLGWAGAEDLWLHGYWTWDWADSYVKVSAIDAETRCFVTEEPHGVYGYKPGQRYYALNLLEELDAPGEWYLNRETGMLYFWPPAPLEGARVEVSVLETVVAMAGVQHCSIERCTIEVCRGAAVRMAECLDSEVAGCTVRGVGTTGIVIEGGLRCGAVSCDVYDCDAGISLSGGDRLTLKGCGHYAMNNHIHDYGRTCRTYRPAIGVHGVGIRVGHNLIHDAPHNGIQLSGNEHLIEFNEVHSICRETGDVGAFYMGRDWSMRGNVIRHNFFHHIEGPYTHGAMAVYLDDAASGTTIYGNVFYQASRAAFIGGGRDNRVVNNIFVDCHPSVHVDARLLGWAKEYGAPGGVVADAGEAGGGGLPESAL